MAGHGTTAPTLEPATAADVEWLLQLRLTTMTDCIERSGQHLSIHGLLEDAARAGVPVVLHVLEVNPAKRLYDRLGFEVVAEEAHSFQMEFDGQPRQPQ